MHNTAIATSVTLAIMIMIAHIAMIAMVDAQNAIELQEKWFLLQPFLEQQHT